jgi:ribosomal protein L37AE/L43A
MAICEELLENPDKRVASDARRLSSYCQHTLNGAGGGVESHAIIARISRMREPKRVCPDCAEKVQRRARVCRFCGYRFAEPAAPSGHWDRRMTHHVLRRVRHEIQPSHSSRSRNRASVFDGRRGPAVLRCTPHWGAH